MTHSQTQSAATVPLSASLTGKTVLLVEDEGFITDLLVSWFARLGVKTLCAGNGQEGIRLLMTNLDSVSVVIADFRLPDMGGDEMCAKLRALRPGLPVLLSSGRYQREAEEAIARGGPTSFLQKPYPLAEVQQKLQKLLETA